MVVSLRGLHGEKRHVTNGAPESERHQGYKIRVVPEGVAMTVHSSGLVGLITCGLISFTSRSEGDKVSMVIDSRVRERQPFSFRLRRARMYEVGE